MPRHDLQQRLALLRVGVLVDESDCLAITLVDRSRPFEDGRNPQAVELGLAVMAFINLDACHSVAMTFVRQRIELAVAAIFAGAVDEFETLISHGVIMNSCALSFENLQLISLR